MRIAILLAAAMSATGAADALAQGRTRTIEVPIQFQRGSTCWSFAGRGTDFTGRFFGGQTVSVRASGDFHMSDGRRNWTEHNSPWQITITGPGGFFVDGEGRMQASLPRTGNYTFSMGPNAIRGNQGRIEICTL